VSEEGLAMNASPQPQRIGLIVPSSSTTMEIEVPELLRRQQAGSGHRFSCHASRLRLRHVTPEALRRVDESAAVAMEDLLDAEVDAILHACVAAGTAQGRAGMLQSLSRLAARARGAAARPAVVSNAAALVAALHRLDASRVALIAPFHRALTEQVGATLAECGIRVVQSRSLEVVSNVEVGRLDPHKLLRLASQLDYSACDALVLSACPQMPSLDVIEQAEATLGLPVVSATTAAVHSLLDALGIEPAIAGAGRLLRRPR
jgi:maleate isomerase